MLLFLKENGHLDVANQERMTPLMNAASKNNVEVARELIELGADVNKQRDLPLHPRGNDVGGETALYFATLADHYEMAQLLLDNGALQMARYNGSTPLHVAWNSKMAKLLIERGGDVHALKEHDETPLHTAAFFGFLDTVQFLVLQTPLSMNDVCDYGTPLEVALTHAQLNVVDFLLHVGASFELTMPDDVLLRWLKEFIDEAFMDSEESECNLRLKTKGVYERVEHYLVSIRIMVREAKRGNVPFFTENLRNGTHYHPMQVIPNMPEKERMELTTWCAAMRADMHHLFILFHSNHSASRLFYPSPVSETLKKMILLPKSTRALLQIH